MSLSNTPPFHSSTYHDRGPSFGGKGRASDGDFGYLTRVLTIPNVLINPTPLIHTTG